MISVIIPTLNEEDSIGATLEYLKGCIHPHLILPHQGRGNISETLPPCGGGIGWGVEIILADGSSKDKTREIASKHGITVLTGTESSRAFLMNLGAKEAKGNILFFLHADSYPPETFITDIQYALRNESIIGGAFDHKFSEDVFSVKVVSFFNRIRFRITKNYYGDQGIFVKKETFDRLGGYRNMGLLEDSDFSERLRRVGKTVLIRKRMLTSGRRFITGGTVRTVIFMMWIRLLYRLGLDTERLAKTYRSFNTKRKSQ